MHSSSKTLALTLLSLCGLGLAAARPASAQNLVYTLSGVTFADGAVATGFFDFNPTTQVSDGYNMTTTNGLNDGLTGANYTLASVPPGYISPLVSGNFSFGFTTNGGLNFLELAAASAITAPGVYVVQPGQVTSPTSLSESGEFVPNNGPGGNLSTGRAISAGFLVVTPAAAVPEASTTVSFGILLALGLGGAVIAGRKKKASA